VSVSFEPEIIRWSAWKPLSGSSRNSNVPSAPGLYRVVAPVSHGSACRNHTALKTVSPIARRLVEACTPHVQDAERAERDQQQ
jgi:hypothetical protein